MTQVIPAVDVLDGRVVRLLRGVYDAMTEYGDDPVASLQRWADAGADLVHVVDLSGARSGAPDPELWRRLGAARVPFQVGGGIRSADAGRAAVAAGAQRVVIGSAAVSDPASMARLVDAVGADRVVAAIDVRDGRARGSGWYDEGRAVESVISDVVQAGIPRALVTGIDRDGAEDGPDLGLLDVVRAAGPSLALIAAGGVGSLVDIGRVAAAGAEAVIVGRALYEGTFSLEEAIDVARETGA
jgi:phosphoribosylformimino-5-aminoimidazole carboxamide ribotide isomerase